MSLCHVVCQCPCFLGDIHGDKVFSGRRIETFIALLMRRIPNKHTCLSLMGEFDLVRAMAMNIGVPRTHEGKHQE